MKAWSIALATLLVLAFPAYGDLDRTIVQELALQPGQLIKVKLALGQILVEGTDGDAVRAEMALHCERSDETCRKKLDRIELLMTTSSDTLRVEAEGLRRSSSGLDVSVRIEVPADRGLELDIGVGDVHIRGVTADVEVDVGVGEVEATLEHDFVHEVELDTGVGTTRLATELGEHRGSGFVGSHLTWSHDGGRSRVEIDTGVGDIEVTIE